MAGRKAITPIIAVILLTMITLAVALSASTFFSKMQSSAQGTTEASASRLMATWGTCAKIVSFKFNPITNQSEAILKNCGFRDINLENENLQLVVKTSEGSCVFKLNSTNCANCVGKIGIGAFTALQINASAIYCASTLADLLHKVVGEKVEVIISDKSASFIIATTFIPENIVNCGLSLNSPPDQNVTGNNPQVACYNYSIQNGGNAIDTYSLYYTKTLAEPTATVNIKQYSNCSGTDISSITVSPGQTKYFGLRVEVPILSSSCGGGGGGYQGAHTWMVGLNAQSTNCAKSAYDDTNTEGYCGPPV
jgi:flagellin-like protein